MGPISTCTLKSYFYARYLDISHILWYFSESRNSICDKNAPVTRFYAMNMKLCTDIQLIDTKTTWQNSLQTSFYIKSYLQYSVKIMTFITKFVGVIPCGIFCSTTSIFIFNRDLHHSNTSNCEKFEHSNRRSSWKLMWLNTWCHSFY